MKISCSLSAFRGDMGGALKQISGVGIKYTDLIAIKGWDHIDPTVLASNWDEEAMKIEKMLEEACIKPVAINFAVAHPYLRDEETVVQRNKEVDALVRLMVRLGVKKGSFYPGSKNDEMDRKQLVENTGTTLYEMYSIAEKHGVVLMPEPHFNTPFQTLAQIRELFDAVPETSIAYDPSHFAMQGIDLRETEFMLDKTAHIHLRDAAPDKMQVPVGKGSVDFKWIVDAAKERGYDGFYAIEYLPGIEGGGLEQIKKLRDLLQEYGV